jgi:hypothetical protein
MYIGLRVNTRYRYEIFMKRAFLDRFSKNIQISDFMKIRQVSAEFFHADGETDKHDTVTFRSFANVPVKPQR